MTSNAVDDICDRIGRVINYGRAEYDMNYAEIIGLLELIKTDLINEALFGAEEELED